MRYLGSSGPFRSPPAGSQGKMGKRQLAAEIFDAEAKEVRNSVRRRPGDRSEPPEPPPTYLFLPVRYGSTMSKYTRNSI
jgi:hypothetical protein